MAINYLGYCDTVLWSADNAWSKQQQWELSRAYMAEQSRAEKKHTFEKCHRWWKQLEQNIESIGAFYIELIWELCLLQPVYVGFIQSWGHYSYNATSKNKLFVSLMKRGVAFVLFFLTIIIYNLTLTSLWSGCSNQMFK